MSEPIPRPPDEIFENHVNNAISQATQEEQDVFELDHVEAPPKGGIYVYLKDNLYPSKGFPFPEAIVTNNVAKRYIMEQMRFFASKDFILPCAILLLFPFKYKIKLLTRWLEGFNSFAGRILQPYFMKENYYMDMSKQLNKACTIFLSDIGVPIDTASMFGKIFAHMIEFDTAYRYRLEDILSETKPEKICANPRLEIARLLEIFKQRDKIVGVQNKFTVFAKILSWSMFSSRIRRAFRNAIADIDFKKLQYDEIDRYNCLRMDERYMFFGKPFAQRMMTYIAMHNGKVPTPTRVKGV